jgi:hypothetical protein
MYVKGVANRRRENLMYGSALSAPSPHAVPLSREWLKRRALPDDVEL